MSTVTRVSGSSGNDTITRSDGAYMLMGGDGNDRLEVTRASNLTGINGQAGNDTLIGSVEGLGQIHMRGGDGNDTIVMRLANTDGHQGHHAYGGSGSDRFVFEDALEAVKPVLGRLDDFDPRRDTLWYGTTQLDLGALASGFRVVAYLGQQWLSVMDRALYALEGARQGGDEVHFSPLPPGGIASLATIKYADPNNFVPSQLVAKRLAEVVDRPLDMTVVVTGAGNQWIRDEGVTQRSEAGALTQVAASRIEAGDGHDIIDAGKGNDTVYGGHGHDLIAGGQDADRIFGGHGNDRIWGGTENDHVEGGGGRDKILGGRGDDFLDGDWGDDRIFGEAGADRIVGGGGNDYLGGGGGNDKLWGGPGDDTLIGNGGKDLLKGGLGRDRLDGSGGRDWIYGGAGADIATGGAGADVFVFRAGDLETWTGQADQQPAPYTAIDRITDFEFGADTIRFLPASGIRSLDQLQAWRVTVDGVEKFVVRVRGTDERLLVQTDADVTWAEFLSADVFIFG